MYMALTGCTGLISIPKPSLPPQTQAPESSLPPQSQAPKVEIPDESMEKPSPSPRALASLRLTDQGRMLLNNGRPDDAIRMLERAVSLNPNNGQNYYYLAEAWLSKGNASQAKGFNHLADIYLEGNAQWMDKVMEQRERIRKYKKQ
jgi:predicted Zn-dependent protease